MSLPLNQDEDNIYSSLNTSYGSMNEPDEVVSLLQDAKLNVVPIAHKSEVAHISSIKNKPYISSSRRSVSVRDIPNDVTHLVPSRNVSKSIRLLGSMAVMALIVLMSLCQLYGLGRGKVYRQRMPIGAYKLISAQEGEDFFHHYDFYEGYDSAGSNGFQLYVSREKAEADGICKIITKKSPSDSVSSIPENEPTLSNQSYVYLGSKATDAGPRDSIRLEGKERYNRGLFIIDLRHMPAGCGTWPAFWLTDEHNWPINGEIDIIEGVNYQTQAKTAMHSTKGCTMENQPSGLATGTWDTAQYVPDAKTGIPDPTLRYSKDCFVYDPKQWLNQGCVGVDLEDNTIGQPLNEKGGGVYVLEWDPVNRHIRSWVFTPHNTIPTNLKDALQTVKLSPEEIVSPDTNLWGLPYAYFTIGEDTDCPTFHFKNMRLVINTAFCGSVSGNRYSMDCPEKNKKFPTCNEYVASNPDELNDAYWEIRGIYIYEREWIVPKSV